MNRCYAIRKTREPPGFESSTRFRMRSFSAEVLLLVWLVLLLQSPRLSIELTTDRYTPIIQMKDSDEEPTRSAMQEDMQPGIQREQQLEVSESQPEPEYSQPELEQSTPLQSGNSRVPPMSLSEFKKKMVRKMQRTVHCGSVTRHRLEPGGEEYNFAAASHGAKLVAANKEAKGAGSILHTDKEKYYRSPCSDEKFVVVELSEEALVDSLVIANYELYASNLKEFELHGSLTYPSEDWRLVGSFEAENTRHAHRFRLVKPEWVRYLKLRMLSHYGTEFYCTLSMIEVYGIDAIECLLEDWVGAPGFQDGSPSTSARFDETRTTSDLLRAVSYNQESSSSEAAEGVVEGPVQPSRLGDSVMKLVMQKVQGLETNQSLFERYVEELNSNYRDHFSDLQENLVASRRAVQNLTASIAGLLAHMRKMESDWEAERVDLESKLQRHFEAEAAYVVYMKNQLEHMENREIVAISGALLLILVSGLGRLIFHTKFHLAEAFLVFVIVVILSA